MGGGCGQRPRGRPSVPVQEVWSGCKVEVPQQRPILMGGGRMGGNKSIQKADNTGGAEGYIKIGNNRSNIV